MTHVVLVEAGFGYTVADPAAIVWTDISDRVDVKDAGISITRGASDEVSEIQPATATLVLNNEDGALTPGLASSPFYPNVKKNCPLRISVATLDSPTGTAPYPIEQLADDFDDDRVNTALWPSNVGAVLEQDGLARIPATAGVTSGYTSARQWTLTGSRTTVRMVTVPAGGTGARASAMVYAVTNGTRIGFTYQADTNQLQCRNEVGFADGASVNLTYDPVAHAWLRIREASGTVFWETSTDGSTWTVRRSLATPAWVGTDQVLYSLSVTRTTGTTDYAEFDLLGARVSHRFHGMVNGWPTKWRGLHSTAMVTCTDMFKWLSRQPALQPMLVEETLADAPLAYYPLAEPDGSTAGGDLGGYGAGAMTIQQAGAGGTLEFGAGTGPAATGQSAPTFAPASSSAGKYLRADLGGEVAAAFDLYGYMFAEAWFATSTAGRVFLGLASDDGQFVILFGLESGTGHLKVWWTTIGGPLAGYGDDVLATTGYADGNLHHFLFDEATGAVYVDGALVGGLAADGMLGLRWMYVGGHTTGQLWNGTVCHAAFYTAPLDAAADYTPHYDAGANGFAGEDADVRLQRLAGYGAVASLGVTGSTFDAVAGQGEGGSTALAMMQQIEQTESARLYANRSDFGLTVESRDRRYNPMPDISLAYADLETDDVEFADDDQKMVNTVIASRPGGATQRVIDKAARDVYGPYQRDLNILKAGDLAVTDAANWLVSRYADPPPELREVVIEAYSMGTTVYRQLLALGINSVLEITGLPDEAEADEVTVFAEGYTETIHHNRHRLAFHCSRSLNDNVWVLNDPVYSVLGSTTRLAY